MIEIPGYTLTEQLYEGETSLVFRGRRKGSNGAVVLKVLKSDHPSLGELAKFRREFDMTRGLSGEGIIRAYQLENYHNSLVIVLEDFGAESLKRLLPGDARRLTQEPPKRSALSLGEFLKLALKLVDAVGHIHSQRIIHKDLNPANIVWNTTTDQVKVIDFGISTQLSRETVSEHNPKVLEGTLAYMSPEQTGRMNRTMDYRTDYYSLGATFYEILTGALPFPVDDPMEMVHCHLAKMPPPPHELKADIPVVLSGIVLKLMAKMAEDRYQSAFGLRADLLCCLEQYNSSANITDFPLGRRDISDQFQIPQKLYGREQEIAALLDAFERVSQGQTEMMLVAGYSGIGKSALVHEIHKPIVRKRGFFLSGKFDQYKRNIPYSSLIQAFQGLLRQLLAEKEALLHSWRAKLLQALGVNAPVIMEIIPELELVVGKQPPVAELPPTESQNRFQRVFQQFVHTFAAADHPLVLFLDDLQWADPPSLKLIASWMTAQDEKYILILGAYRDNEVNAAHPLMAMLDDIRKAGAVMHTLTLPPLELEQINALVADTVHCPSQNALPLAELCFAKTAGNPFFLNQFLHAVHEEGLITFDTHHGLWQWDIEKINDRSMTENVVELMVSKIQKFSPQTQYVLKLAATIGNQFDLKTLSIVNEKSALETASDLWESLQAGFILPLDNAYKFLQKSDSGAHIQYRFLHDRVQQAAYSLVAKSELQALHLKIGRLLLINTATESLDDALFDILEQLNAGRELIEDAAEKLQLAELNLRAGKKAKNATAYQAAVLHLRIGIALLPQDAWQNHYALSLELHRQCAEAEYLSGNFERAQALYPVALSQAQSVLDKISILLVQIVQHHMLMQFGEAIAYLKFGLNLLGFSIPETEEEIAAQIQHLLQEINHNLGDRQIKDLLTLPPMTDPEHLATMQLLRWMFQAAYLDGRSNLVALDICKMVNLSLQHGNSDISSFGYVLYGHIVGWSLGDFKTGYQYGTLGIAIANCLDNISLRADVYFEYAVFILPWNKPLRATEKYYDLSFAYALETGNLVICGYAIAMRASDRLIYGQSLPDLLQACERDLIFLQGTKDQFAFDCLIVGIVEPIRALMGLTEHPPSHGNAHFDEARLLDVCAGLPRKLDWYYHTQIRTAYLFEDRAQWPALIEKLELIQSLTPGQCRIPDAVFYVTLMMLGLSEKSSEEETEALQPRIDTLRGKLQKWAEICPENYLHKHLLVEAECARLQGDYWGAMSLYQGAIASALEQEYTHTGALANELYGKFLLSHNQTRFAQIHLREAHYLYGRWGASAKVADMEQTHGDLLNEDPIRKISLGATHTLTTSSNTLSTTATMGSHALDLAAVVKASQVISGEIVLGRLLEQLMRIVLVNAGAQKGALILRQAQTKPWLLEALGTADPLQIEVLQAQALEGSSDLCEAIVHYAVRTRETVLLHHANQEGIFAKDPYIVRNGVKSVLCVPFLHQGQLVGIIYLENNLSNGAFTAERQEVLALLSSQIAISIENSRLYFHLEEKVQERTSQLLDANQQLESTLQELQAAQAQLILAEKMASLGKLVANVAHEINTPMGAIKSSGQSIADTLNEALKNLPRLGKMLDADSLRLFLQLIACANVSAPVRTTREQRTIKRQLVQQLEEARIGDADTKASVLAQLNAQSALADYLPLLRHPECDFILDTARSVAAILDSASNINTAVERVSKIVTTLKSFSQADNNVGEMTHADLKDGIDAVLSIYSNQIKLATELVRQYEDVPLLRCLPNALKEVWTHLIHNALQAMGFRGRLTVGLKRIGDDAVVSVTDSGSGIPKEIRHRIFEPFFTTRPPGEGSGLGLDIVKKIIDKHHGRIAVQSEVGVGSTFSVYLPLPAARNVVPPPENEDDNYLLCLVDDPEPTMNEVPPWKVLIVDDDVGVHASTDYAIGKLTFQGRPLQIFTALSGAGAREILATEKDIALALIDVVMETEHSGLELVRFIREELCNRAIRLVLRTGQLGQASEHQIMRDHEIDDYQLKTELTKDKLAAIIISNLRTYAHTAQLVKTATDGL